MALFITFEGGEGCGKSTQARALYRRLARSGVSVMLTREPGGTPLGEQTRRQLKRAQDLPISPLAELFLVAAARAQLVREAIRPGLERNITVICDRYTDSTLAYQGYGRGLDLDAIRTVNDIASGGLAPDLVVLLDIPVDVGLARKKAPGRDRFESAGTAFHHRVRRGYRAMARADRKRWLMVDGTLSVKNIQARIWDRVTEMRRGEPQG
ncbi:MAG: dTMP kinase [Chloroflexi bacterium]|nr:dTMP kinase [Chloroflexota bacterium]